MNVYFEVRSLGKCVLGQFCVRLAYAFFNAELSVLPIKKIYGKTADRADIRYLLAVTFVIAGAKKK